MSVTITVPSKTFLLGEYTVLTGGPALILCTEPRFKLVANSLTRKNLTMHNNISPLSPAGKYMKQNWKFYKNFQLDFTDPYHGAGGFGASSAQFAMIYKLKSVILNESNLHIDKLLGDYRVVAWNKGIAPSGADLIAQNFGDICYFNYSKNLIETYKWPFDEIEIFLILTGNKLSTHEYLEKLILKNTDKLSNLVDLGLMHLKTANADGFLNTISEFNLELQRNHLIADTTNNLLLKLSKRQEILASKGCGAMGADVVLAFVKKEHSNIFATWANHQQLHLYKNIRLSPGIKVLSSYD